MNILVTGGAGFIGSHIAEEYLRLGHHVVIIDDLSTGVLRNVPRSAVFYQADIRDESVADILDRHEIDVINHHAAQIDVRRSVQDPRLDVAVNVIGTVSLLEAAVRKRVRRFIFASTGGAVYGEQRYFPADENHPADPLSPYGISKLACEKFLSYYRIVHGLASTVFRYTNVYGPRQNPHGEAGVVAIFSEKMLRGVAPTINGDGMQTRDYVYVADVVRANVLALDMADGESDTFNVSTGVETTVVDIFEALNKEIPEPVRRVHGPEKPGEQRRSVCSWDRIRARMGWEPEIALAEGLRMTLEWFRQSLDRR
ncbi:MAG: GDP-mannose 4,6-dehydratase [Bacteroidota bacterium]|nr:GDP-mannose 4,6-dehydratase [Bacteroidota bacterium]